MLKLLEVMQPAETGLGVIMRIDLTENTEAERQEALTNARILYGPDKTYRWQDCGHDEGKSCKTEQAIYHAAIHRIPSKVF